MINNAEIIIIGAGAAGLMAAYQLTKAGKKVLVLEARDRYGGRIHTIMGSASSEKIELGAEFVHGDLPVTLGLLKEAGIALQPGGGEMWQHRNGRFEDRGLFAEGWDVLTEKLEQLKTDITINEFLEKELPGDAYVDLRQSVRRFASGYDSADPDKASTFALRKEWLEEDEGNQYRVKGGYGEMINYLAGAITAVNGSILLNKIAKEIVWQPQSVVVKTAGGDSYQCSWLLVAVPLGVLRAAITEHGAISFVPEIAGHREALHQIGFGSVVKVLLEFDNAFWEDGQTKALAGKDPKHLGFVLSDEEIPTWWTQVPRRSKVLTGWLSGPAAEAKKQTSDEGFLQLSLKSLSHIFNRSTDELKHMLVASRIVNWTNDPFTLGSYDYDMIGSAAARRILAEPIANTLFFAGEYVYDGPAMGTVEAALTAGKLAAERIINPAANNSPK